MSRSSLNDSNDSDYEEYNEELEEESSFDSEEEEEEIEFYSDNMRAPTASAEEFNSESDSHSSDNSIEDEVRQQIDSNEEYINQFSNIDVCDQISKGNDLKNELIIWDNLLELRIKVQKLLINGNKFPVFSGSQPIGSQPT